MKDERSFLIHTIKFLQVDGADPVQNDNIACTDDSCDETNDVIVNAANSGHCNDGQFCNGVETCEPSASGADAATGCLDGADLVQNDNIACTDDSCDETADVIVNAPNSGHCNDTLFCNGVETCQPSASGADAATGCLDGADPVQNDNIACTDDSCDETNDVIVNAANSESRL